MFRDILKVLLWLALVNISFSQLLRPDVMNLGRYNEETKHYEKTSPAVVPSGEGQKQTNGVDKKETSPAVLGGDDHDKVPHQRTILGGDDHDKVPHERPILGGDDHDKVPHHRTLLGGDDHDMVPHSQKLLETDDHDKKLHHRSIFGDDGHATMPHRELVFGVDVSRQRQHHRRPILGAGDHDLKPHSQKLLRLEGHNKLHGRPILGGDDHDRVPHRRPILGGDDHDRVPHRRPILGGDDHDRVPHRRPILGGDDHDRVPHRRPILGGDDHDRVPHRRPLLGGDDHDRVPHRRPLLGGDDHDRVPHRRPILGGDDHDRVPHRRPLLGRDDHDRVPHRRPILGGDDHDKVPHRRPILGGDDHDKVPHHRPILGGDDHDRVPHHRPILGGDDHDRVPHRVNALFSFQSFMREHDKQYDSQDEFRKRFSIFRQNLQRIKQLRRSELGSATYGVTKFSDLSEEEFSKMLGFKPELRRPSEKRQVVSEVAAVDLPDSYDWRNYNVVTPVKNQGMCGSCWAFSTTGNVEGQWSLKHNELLSLSEQELVDCDKEDHGCEGGLPENAYEAIEKLGGLETEDQYPYDGHDGTCHMEQTKAKVQVNGSLELPTDETEIARWLYKNGPVSIGLNANALQFYTGGVSHPMRFLCNPKGINHGVLIVGYGTHITKYLHRVQPYWIIKNSWGTTWGEQGYFRMYRGDGTCGLNLMATSAVVP